MGGMLKTGRGGSYRSPWKFISQGLHLFLQNIKMGLGKRNKIRFWEDLWVGDILFSARFPRLFELFSIHNPIIENMFARDSSSSISLSLGFRRNLND